MLGSRHCQGAPGLGPRLKSAPGGVVHPLGVVGDAGVQGVAQPGQVGGGETGRWRRCLGCWNHLGELGSWGSAGPFWDTSTFPITPIIGTVALAMARGKCQWPTVMRRPGCFQPGPRFVSVPVLCLWLDGAQHSDLSFCFVSGRARPLVDTAKQGHANPWRIVPVFGLVPVPDPPS